MARGVWGVSLHAFPHAIATSVHEGRLRQAEWARLSSTAKSAAANNIKKQAWQINVKDVFTWTPVWKAGPKCFELAVTICGYSTIGKRMGNPPIFKVYFSCSLFLFFWQPPGAVWPTVITCCYVYLMQNWS